MMSDLWQGLLFTVLPFFTLVAAGLYVEARWIGLPNA